jgi:hypothetical protein
MIAQIDDSTERIIVAPMRKVVVEELHFGKKSFILSMYLTMPPNAHSSVSMKGSLGEGKL